MRRMRILPLILILVTVGLARTNQDDEVNAPEKLIKSVAFLEQKPLDKKAKDLRSWALKWIAANDRVSVRACSLLSGSIAGNYQYDDEVLGQYKIAMAAFKLAYPDKANDEDAAQLAGVEGALTVYAAIIRTHPAATNAFLDDLVTRHGQGAFPKYVKDHNCR